MQRGRPGEPVKTDVAIQCRQRRRRQRGLLVQQRPHAADGSSSGQPLIGKGPRSCVMHALSNRARHSAGSTKMNASSSRGATEREGDGERATDRALSVRKKKASEKNEKINLRLKTSTSPSALLNVRSHRPSHALRRCCRPPFLPLFPDGLHEEGSLRCFRGCCQGQGPALHIREEDGREEIERRGQVERRRRRLDHQGPRRRRKVPLAGQAGDGRGHLCRPRRE